MSTSVKGILSFAREMKNLRLCSGLSAEQAAEQVNVNPSLIKEMEDGTAVPAPSMLLLLLELYGYSLEETLRPADALTTEFDFEPEAYTEEDLHSVANIGCSDCSRCIL